MLIPKEAICYTPTISGRCFRPSQPFWQPSLAKKCPFSTTPPLAEYKSTLSRAFMFSDTKSSGAPRQNRTANLLFTRQPLCLLSYRSIISAYDCACAITVALIRDALYIMHNPAKIDAKNMRAVLRRAFFSRFTDSARRIALGHHFVAGTGILRPVLFRH